MSCKTLSSAVARRSVELCGPGPLRTEDGLCSLETLRRAMWVNSSAKPLRNSEEFQGQMVTHALKQNNLQER